MGLLLDTASGRLITLSAHSLIGRSSACLVRIDDPRVSAEHAVILWSGEHWEVRDLGSLNGTWLDGRRLAASERAAIGSDARLAFAGSTAWLIADQRAPGPAACSEATSDVVHSPSGLLALPSAGDPQVTIFQRDDGQWLVERGSAVLPVAGHDAVEVAGARWVLYLPDGPGRVRTTLANDAGRRLRGASLRFAPSLDEEHVDIHLRTEDGRESALPPRSSHYMLLTLARARLDDAQRGVVAEEQGWVHAADLAEMLRYSPERLNLEIFRARALLAKLGVADSVELIERRPMSRQLRIGVSNLRVDRG